MKTFVKENSSSANESIAQSQSSLLKQTHDLQFSVMFQFSITELNNRICSKAKSALNCCLTPAEYGDSKLICILSTLYFSCFNESYQSGGEGKLCPTSLQSGFRILSDSNGTNHSDPTS